MFLSLLLFSLCYDLRLVLTEISIPSSFTVPAVRSPTSSTSWSSWPSPVSRGASSTRAGCWSRSVSGPTSCASLNVTRRGSVSSGPGVCPSVSCCTAREAQSSSTAGYQAPGAASLGSPLPPPPPLGLLISNNLTFLSSSHD